MTQAVARILAEADRLSASERAELTDRLVESVTHENPAVVAQAQIAEVRRRIAQVAANEVTLVPGDVALTQVRALLDS